MQDLDMWIYTHVQHKGPYQGALMRQGNVYPDHDMLPHSD